MAKGLEGAPSLPGVAGGPQTMALQGLRVLQPPQSSAEAGWAAGLLLWPLPEKGGAHGEEVRGAGLRQHVHRLRPANHLL